MTQTYSCPYCGWGTDQLPDAVASEHFPGTTKGHSDQSTHICPECGEEGWNQGWCMDGTHDD
jgi:uncharacterized protein with PIN domain